MLISKNAYLILGLGTDTDEKLLNKRHKEILKILEIDEIPEYDLDISFIKYKKIRNVESVKWAFHELSNQKKRLYQDFLWFQLVDTKDEKLFKQLCEGNILEAIVGWKDLYDTTGKYHYLKNLFVSNLLGFENQKQFNDLDFSDDCPEIINSLHECIESEKFWKEFLKIINLSYETPLSNDELNKFKGEIIQYLAEEFFDLSEELKTPKLYVQYSKVFGVNAKELDDNENVTKPLSVIEKNSKKIKELDLGSDLDEIIDLINEIEDEVKKLTKVGLQKNPKIIKVIDDVSLQIRSLGIALVNDHEDRDTAIDFINEALSLSPSTTISQKLKKDIKDITGLESQSKIIKKLTDMMNKGNEFRKDGNYGKTKEQYDVLIDYIENTVCDELNLNRKYLSAFKTKTKAQINCIYAGMSEEQIQNIVGEIDKVKGFIERGGYFNRGELEVGQLSEEEQVIYMLYIDAVTKATMSSTIQQKKQEKRTEGCRSWVIWIIIMIIIAAAKGAFD